MLRPLGHRADVSARSARVRILGERSQVAFRAVDIARAVPAQIVTVRLRRRWDYRDAAYGSGLVRDVRTDIAMLGLEPLSLSDEGMDDPAEWSEPYADGSPFAALWTPHTGRADGCSSSTCFAASAARTRSSR